MDNYVQEIREFIVNNMLIKFSDVKSMQLGPRINLLIEAVVSPSKEFIAKASPYYSVSVREEDKDSFMVVFVGSNNEDFVNAVKEALLVY